MMVRVDRFSLLALLIVVGSSQAVERKKDSKQTVPLKSMVAEQPDVAINQIQAIVVNYLLVAVKQGKKTVKIDLPKIMTEILQTSDVGQAATQELKNKQKEMQNKFAEEKPRIPKIENK